MTNVQMTRTDAPAICIADGVLSYCPNAMCEEQVAGRLRVGPAPPQELPKCPDHKARKLLERLPRACDNLRRTADGMVLDIGRDMDSAPAPEQIARLPRGARLCDPSGVQLVVAHTKPRPDGASYVTLLVDRDEAAEGLDDVDDFGMVIDRSLEDAEMKLIDPEEYCDSFERWREATMVVEEMKDHRFWKEEAGLMEDQWPLGSDADYNDFSGAPAPRQPRRVRHHGGGAAPRHQRPRVHERALRERRERRLRHRAAEGAAPASRRRRRRREGEGRLALGVQQRQVAEEDRGRRSRRHDGQRLCDPERRRYGRLQRGRPERPVADHAGAVTGTCLGMQLHSWDVRGCRICLGMQTSFLAGNVWGCIPGGDMFGDADFIPGGDMFGDADFIPGGDMFGDADFIPGGDMYGGGGCRRRRRRRARRATSPAGCRRAI